MRDEALKSPTFQITTISSSETRPRNILTMNDEVGAGLLLRGMLNSLGTKELRS